MIKPKRVWDSLQRTVRQWKKQVWDVNWEMKLNWWNKREEADSSQFQVYWKTYESPVEPFITYDKGWSEEGGWWGDKGNLEWTFLIDFDGEPEDTERQIKITLYDDQQNTVCSFSFLTNENTQEITFNTIEYWNSPLTDKVYQQKNAWETLCSSYASRFLYRFGVCPMYDVNDGKCPYNLHIGWSFKTDENLYQYFVEYFSTGSTANLFAILESDGWDGSLYVDIDFSVYLMDSENWEEAEYDLIHNWDDNDKENAYFCKTPDWKNGIDLLWLNDSPECVAHGLFTLSYFYNDYEWLIENVFCHNFITDQSIEQGTWYLSDFIIFMFGSIKSGSIEYLGRVSNFYKEDYIWNLLSNPQQSSYENYIQLMYNQSRDYQFIDFKQDTYDNTCIGIEEDSRKEVRIDWAGWMGVDFVFEGENLNTLVFWPIQGVNKFNDVIDTLLSEYSVQDIASIFDLDNMTISWNCASMSAVLSSLVLKGTGNVNDIVDWFKSAIEGGDKIVNWQGK